MLEQFSVFGRVLQHISERIASLSWALENMQMIAPVKHGTGPAGHLANGSTKCGTEAAHPSHQGFIVGDLKYEMDVVGLN